MANKALLIGISDYSKVDRLKNLNGCKNDLIYMNYILKTYGKFGEIIILNDSLANSKNIKKNFESIITTMDENGLMVFYFSGHGSQVKDQGEKDESDNLDEVLCPYNMDWKSNFISDDYFNQIITQKLNPDTTLEVIIDSCFSGGFFKGDESLGKNKYLEMPLELQLEFNPEKLSNTKYSKIGCNQYLNPNVIYWLSCNENEKAGQGFNSRTGCDISYFTYSFCHNIQNNHGKLTRQSLITLIQNDFSKINQTPQLHINQSNLTKSIYT